MIDKNKRFQKEQAKAKTRKRIHVEIDPDNYDYIPEVKQTSYYDNDVPQRVAIPHSRLRMRSMPWGGSPIWAISTGLPRVSSRSSAMSATAVMS